MKKFIILALVSRVIIMSVTVHSDLWTVVIGGYLFADKGILDIHSYYLSLSKSHELVKSFTDSFFPYPPLVLFTFGLWIKIIGLFISHNFMEILLSQMSKVLLQKNLIWYIFWFKLLYLFFDFGIGYILWKMFTTFHDKKRALLMWLFNPVVYYSLAVGNFDLIPTFFAVLSLYLIGKNRLLLAAFILGIAAAHKMFPLFFLPFLLFSSRRTLVQIKVILLGILPLLLSIAPLFNSKGFRSMVLFSPLTQKFLESKLLIAGNSGISYVLTGVIILCLLFFYQATYKDIWKYYLAVMLVFFSLTNYHLQWFIWIIPFLVMEQVKNKFTHWVIGVLLVGSWAILVLFSSTDLHLGLFVPIKTLGILTNVDSKITGSLSPQHIVTVNNILIDFPTLARSIFAGASLVFIFFLLKENKVNRRSGT